MLIKLLVLLQIRSTLLSHRLVCACLYSRFVARRDYKICAITVVVTNLIVVFPI
jgi:hypothetical protein